LWAARNLDDPVRRYRYADAVQERYRTLAEEAGHIKMQATADLVNLRRGDVEYAAEQLGRDTRWVADTVRLMKEL
jgi:hypothetical protein